MTCIYQAGGKPKTTTKAPPKLVTSWDDDWEEERTTHLPPTAPPHQKKRKKKEERTARGPPPCLYHRASFAPGNSGFLMIECLGPGIPSTAIYRVLPEYSYKAIKLVVHIQNNTRLTERIARVALPQVKTFPVMISGGYHAHVRMFLPPGLREDEITRYPMILHM